VKSPVQQIQVVTEGWRSLGGGDQY
jgi:hypothetical protein